MWLDESGRVSMCSGGWTDRTGWGLGVGVRQQKASWPPRAQPEQVSDLRHLDWGGKETVLREDCSFTVEHSDFKKSWTRKKIRNYLQNSSSSPSHLFTASSETPLCRTFSSGQLLDILLLVTHTHTHTHTVPQSPAVVLQRRDLSSSTFPAPCPVLGA